MAQLKKIARLIKDAWLMVGITILSLGLLEGSLAVAFRVKDRVTESGLDSRVSADTYTDRSWVPGLFHEMTELGLATADRWEPYVYYRHQPYRGQYFNIDSNGLRLTTTAAQGQPLSGPPTKIFVFGGSTMWGAGARDAFTIPSILAKALRKEGVNAEVTNYGEIGWVSTQELLALMIQLRKGHIPDLVIFYDGVNDTFSAFQQHIAGLPQNEFNRVKEFGVSTQDKLEEQWAMGLRNVAARLAITRALEGLRKHTGVGTKPVASPPPAAETGSLAEGVLAAYVGNIELVRALGAHYHFKYLFYWQPTIYQKTYLTPYERTKRDTRQEQFFLKTYDVMRQSGLADRDECHFHDLSSVFADVRDPEFIDWNHLGESGNAMIAMRMLSDVRGAVGAGDGTVGTAATSATFGPRK